MIGTYKRGAINIAISIPLFFLIALSMVITDSFLILNIIPFTITFILYFSFMYKLYTNKKVIFYNIGQFITLLCHVIVIYYIYNTNIINSVALYFT